MVVRHNRIASLGFLTLLICSVFNASALASEIAPIELQLTVTWGVVNNSKIPLFNIAITNVSTAQIRVLDVRNRTDFVDSYLDVQIVPLDRNFELSRAISDPNEINEIDFVELSPGEILEFKSIMLPIDYRELVPGQYIAQGVYRIAPTRRPLEIYKSDEVIFEMK